MPNANEPVRFAQITDLHLKTESGSLLWGVDVDAGLLMRYWPTSATAIPRQILRSSPAT